MSRPPFQNSQSDTTTQVYPFSTFNITTHKVLENHHAATAFKLLRDEEYNIFENLNFADYKSLRQKTISNILATDMKFHFQCMKKFKEQADSGQKINQQELSGLMVHLADLSSPTQSWEVAKTWSIRVCKEFTV